MKFQSLSAWIKYCDYLLRTRDLDNIVLLTGDPGNGKSTLAYQLGVAFDPSFSEERMHFTIEELIRDAKAREKYQAVAADELLMNRRHAMRKETKELLDFLQICRGLNLTMLLCFPHVARLDRAVLDDRVRWRIHIEKQGVATLLENVKHTTTDYTGHEIQVAEWKPSLVFSFGRNEGPRWERYLAKKIAKARERDIAQAENEPEVQAEIDEAERIWALEHNRKGQIRRKPRRTRLDEIIADGVVRTGRHPKGCGKTFPCPTGLHT